MAKIRRNKYRYPDPNNPGTFVNIPNVRGTVTIPHAFDGGGGDGDEGDVSGGGGADSPISIGLVGPSPRKQEVMPDR